MRGRGLLLGALALALTLPAYAIVGEQSAPASSQDLQSRLQIALQAQTRGNAAVAQAALEALIADPQFSTLESQSQHVALQVAAQTSLQTNKPELAHEFATRATEMAEQAIDDWKYRLSAAVRLHDAADEVLCVSTIAHVAGRERKSLSDLDVMTTVRDSDQADLQDKRLDMLQRLYVIQWRPQSDTSASYLWRETSFMLLQHGQRDRAREVSANISEPYTLATMRADNRFAALYSLSGPGPKDVHHAVSDQVIALQQAMRDAPRSLERVYHLQRALNDARRYQDTLQLGAEVSQRVQASGEIHPYDDMKWQSWVALQDAAALAQLGHDDQALAQTRYAIGLIDPSDTVNQSINIADDLCEYGRAAEALTLLPKDTQVSAYGRMQIELVRATAAIELTDTEAADSALAYLRSHQADAPNALQRALLRANALDESEQLLITRLADAKLRSAALEELQEYARPAAPALEVQWHQRWLELRQRPAVKAAIAKVGRVENYPWLEYIVH